MASLISHAVASLGIGAIFYRSGTPRGVWLAGALCSVAPDLDVIGFRFGVRYADFWGHRGFTHSLAFAAILASAALLTFFRRVDPPGMGRLTVWIYLFLSTASHGLLDAMTDGGLGVAFFSPFNNSRYFLPWTPIHVSPLGVTRFFSARGLAVLRSELLVIWLPSAAAITTALILRRARAPNSNERS